MLNFLGVKELSLPLVARRIKFKTIVNPLLFGRYLGFDISLPSTLYLLPSKITPHSSLLSQ